MRDTTTKGKPMGQKRDMCFCGWIGDNFKIHHEDTEFEDDVHIEISPLMVLFLQQSKAP